MGARIPREMRAGRENPREFSMHPRGDPSVPRGDWTVPVGDWTASVREWSMPGRERTGTRGDLSAPGRDRAVPLGDRSVTRGERSVPRGERTKSAESDDSNFYQISKSYKVVRVPRVDRHVVRQSGGCDQEVHGPGPGLAADGFHDMGHGAIGTSHCGINRNRLDRCLDD